MVSLKTAGGKTASEPALVGRRRKFSYAAVIVLAAMIPVRGMASAANVYVAQTAAGGANGGSCENAYALTFFNNAGNWGAGPGQIGPGTVVHLCGTISSALTAQGGGTSSSPVTIAFDCASRAQISMTAIPATGALTIYGSYVIVDGGGCGFRDGAHARSGISFNQIQSTSNGQSGYANSVGSQGIIANGVAGLTVRNLTCGPLYLHNTPTETTFGAPYPVCVNFTGQSSETTIDNNAVTDCAWCFWGQGQSVTVSNNNCINFDHCLGMGIASTTPAVWGPVYFFGNSLSNAVTWDTGGVGQYHHDGLHLWAYCSDGGSYCSGTYWNNVFVYNNHFSGNWGAINTTAFVFFEENVHNAWIFNNLADCSYSGIQCDDGVFSTPGTNVALYNNTIAGSLTQVTPLVLAGGPGLAIANNILSTGPDLIGISAADESGASPTTILNLRNNIYMSGLSDPWVWKGTFIGSLDAWSAASGEANALYFSTSTVNLPAGTLQRSSPAVGAGANLYGLCNSQANPGLGALCSDANGIPRPSIGPWDAGAFSFSAVPQPPANVRASVQ